MKLRLLPIAISVIVSSVVFFGGWFAYNSVAKVSPLESVVAKAPGVEHASVEYNRDNIGLKLTLKPEADLREILRNIHKQGDSYIGSRNVSVDVVNASSPELDRWWSQALFDVAGAMETKQYARIPETLAGRAKDKPNLKVDTQMDDAYVYVRLTDGTANKFVMLPRNPDKLGVWPNE